MDATRHVRFGLSHTTIGLPTVYRVDSISLVGRKLLFLRKPHEQVVELPLDGIGAAGVRINLAPLLTVVDLIRQVKTTSKLRYRGGRAYRPQTFSRSLSSPREIKAPSYHRSST